MKSGNVFSMFVAMALAVGGHVHAQIVIPDVSPLATVTQKVGFSEVRIEYSRPSVRGRVVYGELVPYDVVWRTGANSSTKLYVREAITVQDEYRLPPGMYSLYTIPRKDEWTIIINKDSWLWGTIGYTAVNDVLRFNVKPQPMKEQVETFTIDFANVCISCAEIQLLWDFTRVSFRISTSIDDKVMEDIKKFTANPEAKLAGEYYLSAKYYLDTNRDLKQALEWIDKALHYAPGAYWMTHTKAEILARMGDYKGAIEAAERSIDEAKAENSEEYVRMNEMEITRWKALRKGKSGS